MSTTHRVSAVLRDASRRPASDADSEPEGRCPPHSSFAVIEAIQDSIAARGLVADEERGDRPLHLHGAGKARDVDTKFVVPTMFNDGTEIPTRLLTDFTIELFSIGSGATLIPEFGVWKNGGKLYLDRGLLFFVSTFDLPGLRELLARWAALLGQEEIFLVIDPGAEVHRIHQAPAITERATVTE